MPPRQEPEELFDLEFGSMSIVNLDGATSRFCLGVNGTPYLWGDPEDYDYNKIYRVVEELEEIAQIIKGA